MTVEEGMIVGVGILASLCSYYAFQFLRQEHGGEDGDNHEKNHHTLNWAKILGVLCFILAIVFSNMLMYMLVLIAQNNNLGYLNDTVLVVGMQTIMWATIGGLALYVTALTLGSLYFLYDNVMFWWKGRGKGDVL